MSDDNTPELSMEYLLGKIEQISNDTAYLREAITAVQAITQGSTGDIAGQAKAMAMGDAIKARETTNQQLLRLYEKMYDDLKNPTANEDMRRMEQLRQIAEMLKGASPPSMGSIRRLAEKMLGLDDDGDDD